MVGTTNEAWSGLSRAQAAELLFAEGPNEIPRRQARSLLRITLDVFREPMLALLLVGGVVYLLLGDTTEALLLTVFAAFSITITIVQERRSEGALDALRELSAPRALVIRDGVATRIAGREVVRGDLLVLEAGDRVAADGVVLRTTGLEADESMLTGESVPVRKSATASTKLLQSPGGDDQPFVYSSSMITRGSGVAQVTATGAATEVGKLGRSLAELDTEVPRLRVETARIVTLCAIGGGSTALFVVLLYGLRGDWLPGLLAGITVGMALLPEEFAVVLTVFLAMGAWRIAKQKVLTRRAAAIETLGAATVLCTDKTGTLTQNRMAVSGLWTPSGAKLGSLPGDGVPEEFRELLAGGALASDPAPSDPMEAAIHEVVPRAHASTDRDLVHTFALRPDLLAMSNVWQDVASGDLMLAAKGAPEAIARLCRLDPPRLADLERAATEMAESGMRVLGVATAEASGGKLAEDHLDHSFSLLGLVGLSDPLRPGVAEAVTECRAAGIRVIMITGDYPATARAIARQAGFVDGGMLTGSELAALSDNVLASRVASVTVFARTMPDQKLRIVNALKAAGETVAMTGDGVNDAPALRAAHIGIAMGKRGTDVAREAAALVLLDDDFSSIVAAVRLGRRIYDNIRKAVGFIFAVHVPIAGLAVLPLVTGLPILFGPIQIALLEMIIDPACAIVFEAESEEPDCMTRPPRSPRDRLMSRGLIGRSLVQGFLVFAALAALYLGGSHLGVARELRSLTFFSLVGALLALIVADRAFGRSLLAGLARDNRAFAYAAAAMMVGSILILALAPLRDLLGFTSLGLRSIVLLVAVGIGLVLVLQQTKRIMA